MIVVVSAGTAELLEPDVLTALAVRSAVPPADLAAAVEAQGIGRADPDGSHVWLEPRVLLGPGEGDADRASAIAGVIAYAGSRGWVDAAGRVRAHVEVPTG